MKQSGPGAEQGVQSAPMNLPNLVTLIRILLVPVFALAYLLPGDALNLYAGMLFALAASTDWLDGFLARKLGQATDFGAFLDPVADKLIVVVALTLLIGRHANLWLTLPGLIIVGREVLVSALREWMAEMNRRGLVAVSLLGKVKTTLQMAAITLLLVNAPEPLDYWVVGGYALLYAAAFLTLWSMFIHLAAARPALKLGLKRR